MALNAYKENLDLFSKRLPFESKLFIESFKEFNEYRNSKSLNSLNDSDKKESIEIYKKYKLLLLYTLKIKCKLVEDLLIVLIPKRMQEFEQIIMDKKDNLFEIYFMGLLTEAEYKEILEIIDIERRSIINRALENRIIVANLIPSFSEIRRVIRFAKLIKENDNSIDISFVYQWRRKQRLRVILKWFGF